MRQESQASIGDDEWVTVRGFKDDGAEGPLPEYEAKFVEGVEEPYPENELVLVKRTGPHGHERIYHFPKAFFADVAARLPG